MSRPEREIETAVGDEWGALDGVPGVTRLDVMWRPGSDETVMAATANWVQSRVLPGPAGDRVACLVRAALNHGSRFAPRAATLLIRWQDHSRVRIDVRWVGATYTATDLGLDPDQEVSTAVFDAFADEWGVGPRPSGWVQWMIIDTG